MRLSSPARSPSTKSLVWAMTGVHSTEEDDACEPDVGVRFLIACTITMKQRYGLWHVCTVPKEMMHVNPMLE